MHRIERRLAFVWLLATLPLAACGPDGASPMPEPPSLEIDRVGPPEVQTAFVGDLVTLAGPAGSTTDAVFVRVTNLDTTDPIVVTTVASDGSFSISVPANPGNELRFQATNDSVRGAPIDVVFDGTGLIRMNRPSCVELSPGYELDFAGASSDTLGITNQCTAAVALGTPTTRLGLTEFSVASTAASIPVGDSQTASAVFTPSDGSEREDVVFLPIDVAGQTVRYPVTLFGTSAP